MTTLSILVPTYNEQYLVETSLRNLEVLGCSPLLSRISVIVVDDASTDQTQEVLRRFSESIDRCFGAGKFEWTFLRHEQNQGKGAAIRTALEIADTDLVVIHDADLEYHPRDLLKMIPLFEEEHADAVIGSRFLPGDFKRALLFFHALGNSLLTFLCDMAADLNLTDMETCYKMVRTRLLKSIPLESRDFRIEPELVIKLAKRRVRIFEVPISYSGRTYQEGKKINWKDGVRAFGAILKFALSDRIYTHDEYGSDLLARLARAPRFTRWMADTLRPYVGERVLELGAGTGNLALSLVPRTLYWATDVNPLHLDELRTLHHTRPYLRVSFADATRADSFPSGEEFDTVVCVNVIEHLEDDVGCLRNLWSVLRQGGCAIVVVPHDPRLYGSIDRLLGHCRRYRKEALIAAGEAAGFRVREVLGFNRAASPAWWLNGKVLGRTTFGLVQIKILNLLVPLFRRIDSWLPLPPLSLIAVFEKGRPQASEQTSPATARQTFSAPGPSRALRSRSSEPTPLLLPRA